MNCESDGLILSVVVALLAIGPITSRTVAQDSLQPDSSSQGFALCDETGQHMDVSYGGRLIARYMYAFDPSTDERRHETYKPYLHIFGAEGKRPITKGPGGLYTHHRGIFVGWNKVTLGNDVYDHWHMRNVNQVHQKFLETSANANHAVLSALIHWNDPSGKPVVEEERVITFQPLPAPGIVQLDLTTRLTAPQGDLILDGDPEHAGIQYRPANEVITSETRYVFPKQDADPRQDRDYPWVAETYTLGGHRYSVVHMNHPQNPKGTIYSAYRDYGRFGAFFTYPLKRNETLALRYRLLIWEGELPPQEQINERWASFAR